MIDFESMLEDIVKEKAKERKPGEQREIVIRYATGRENEARVTEGSTERNAKGEDQIAIMYALGKSIGEASGLDGEKLGKAILVAVTKIMMKEAVALSLGGLFDD